MIKNLKKAFTIIELVIVIAVIAILAAVMIPTYSSLVEKANLSADQVAVKNMNTILSSDEISDGKPNKPEEVREILYNAGVNSFNLLTTTKGYSFYWYETDNVVILVNDENSSVVYPDEYKGKNTTDLGVGKTFPLGNLPYAKISIVDTPTTLTKSNVGMYQESGSSSTELAENVQIKLDSELNFSAIHTFQEAERLPYGNYYCDYVITINKDLSATNTKYYIAGSYDGYQGGNWIVYNVTNSPTGSYYLLSGILSQRQWTYADICLLVKNFKCGIAVTGDGDSELTVTVQLVMWETDSDYTAKTNGHIVSTYIYSYANN